MDPNVNDPEIRDQVMDYFADKIYLYEDKLLVIICISEDKRQQITWRDWFSLDEYWTDASPFAEGGSPRVRLLPPHLHDLPTVRYPAWGAAVIIGSNPEEEPR